MNNRMKTKAANHYKQMTNEEIAKQLRVYWIASPLYKLPTYLTELLDEAAKRLDATKQPTNDFDEMGLS